MISMIVKMMRMMDTDSDFWLLIRQVLCDAGLITALEDVLSRSEVCAGGGESALGVLQVLELLAAQLFTTAGAAGSKDCAPVGGMCEIGDWVTVKPGAGIAGGEGIVTDHLGMGDVCVAWAEGGGKISGLGLESGWGFSQVWCLGQKEEREQGGLFSKSRGCRDRTFFWRRDEC
jgi:hypothetical protein